MATNERAMVNGLRKSTSENARRERTAKTTRASFLSSLPSTRGRLLVLSTKASKPLSAKSFIAHPALLMRNAAKVNIKRSFKGGVPLEARKSDQSAGERRSADRKS